MAKTKVAEKLPHPVNMILKNTEGLRRIWKDIRGFGKCQKINGISVDIWDFGVIISVGGITMRYLGLTGFEEISVD